jgi:hypothetical protein
VAAPLLALLLFPGLGTIGVSLGMVVARVMQLRFGVALPRIEGATSNAPPAPRAPADAADALPDERVETLLGRGDTHAKLAVIRRARLDCDPNSVRIIRRLLLDRDQDVRNEAAVSLCRLDAAMHREIDEAFLRARACDDAAQPHADLAELCRRYAVGGLIDEISARFYLVHAQSALREATRIEPGRHDLCQALTSVEGELDSHGSLIS